MVYTSGHGLYPSWLRQTLEIYILNRSTQWAQSEFWWWLADNSYRIKLTECYSSCQPITLHAWDDQKLWHSCIIKYCNTVCTIYRISELHVSNSTAFCLTAVCLCFTFAAYFPQDSQACLEHSYSNYMHTLWDTSNLCFGFLIKPSSRSINHLYYRIILICVIPCTCWCINQYFIASCFCVILMHQQTDDTSILHRMTTR